ncbi:MAG: hypothetical protein ACXAD7_06670 [Candidatus Kariarchaeaceae archaeon]|jgi:hypothetical protein
MAFYRTLAFLIGLILIGVSIFMFLEERDDDARLYLFLAIYAYIGFFYLLKALYYLRHRATFNEISFVVGLAIVPVIIISLGRVTEFDELYSSDLLMAQITLPSQTFEFSLSLSSLLAIPYFFFSLYLLLRSFIRYQFIRWKGHSKSGPPATLVGLLLAVTMGISYLVLSIVLGDLLLGIFGFMYAVVGIFGFLA